MVTSCTTTLQACLHATEVAQSAIAQCAALGSTLAKTPENHIYHAVAVFSELGLAISSATVFDPLKWDERAAQINKDAIAKKDLESILNKSHGKTAWEQSKWLFRYLRVSLWHSFIVNKYVRVATLYIFPLVGFLLALTSLFGMSGIIFHMDAERTFWYGFSSFVISIFLPFILAIGSRKVQQFLSTEID